MSENPVMTFPIKKIINTEHCVLVKGQSFVYKKCDPNFLANLKRVKMLAPKPTICGNDSLFEMRTVKGEMRYNNGSLFEMSLTCKATSKSCQVNYA